MTGLLQEVWAGIDFCLVLGWIGLPPKLWSVVLAQGQWYALGFTDGRLVTMYIDAAPSRSLGVLSIGHWAGPR